MKNILFFVVFFFYSNTRIDPKKYSKKDLKDNIFGKALKVFTRYYLITSIVLIGLFFLVVNPGWWYIFAVLPLIFYSPILDHHRNVMINWYKKTKCKIPLDPYDTNFDVSTADYLNEKVKNIGEATLEKMSEEIYYL